jgi:hypothetical protein
MELLDEIDPFAAVIGARQYHLYQRRRTRGYNTDGEGFLKAWKPNVIISIAGRSFHSWVWRSGQSLCYDVAFHDAGQVFL